MDGSDGSCSHPTEIMATLHLAAKLIANCAIQCSIVCITIVCRSKFGVQLVICE